MADIKQQFTGLPLGLLVCTPIIEVAKGQAELCRVYLDYVFKLAYKDGKQDGEANVIKFKLNRPVTDGEGNISQQEIEVSAPLISLVPVPAFTMDEATVQFTMEVKEQVVDTSSKDTSTSSQFGASFWGFNAQLSGSVTTSASNTRSTATCWWACSSGFAAARASSLPRAGAHMTPMPWTGRCTRRWC